MDGGQNEATKESREASCGYTRYASASHKNKVERGVKVEYRRVQRRKAKGCDASQEPVTSLDASPVGPSGLSRSELLRTK